MQTNCPYRGTWLATVCLAGVAAIAGCASGPLAPLAFLNPKLRQEWREDEEYGVTFRQRMEALEQLHRRLPRMDESERGQTSQQLADLVREDPNPLIRRRAALALGDVAGTASDQGLQAAAADTDASVRVAACQAWAARRDAAGMNALIEILRQDEDEDVQLAAARGLSQYADPAAVAALGEALESQNPALQVRSMESLARVTGEDLGRDVRAWKQYVETGRPVRQEPESIADRLGLPSFRR